jgi:DNA-binding transcriptional ArsR family regulator
MRKDDHEEGDRLAHDPLPAYIERFASVLTDSGIPRMPSRVFAALITRDDGRLTSQELSELLDISPAAVSGAIRYLSQVNLVTRERQPGTRRDRYRVLDEVWQQALFERDTIMARWEASLAEGVAVVGADTPAGRRLTESVQMFQFLRGELSGMLERWQAHRATLRAEAEKAGAGMAGAGMAGPGKAGPGEAGLEEAGAGNAGAGETVAEAAQSSDSGKAEG